MEPFELIFNNDPKEGIHSGGFSVNSVMLKKGIPPLKTLNFRKDTIDDYDVLNDNNKNELMGGGTSQVADLFNSLVVPNWAFSEGKMFGGMQKNAIHSVNYDGNDEDDYHANDDTLDEDLHSKLLDLVKEHEKKENAVIHRKNGKNTKRNLGKNHNNGGTKKVKK